MFTYLLIGSLYTVFDLGWLAPKLGLTVQGFIKQPMILIALYLSTILLWPVDLFFVVQLAVYIHLLRKI